jgi:hypothetical protein
VVGKNEDVGVEEGLEDVKGVGMSEGTEVSGEEVVEGTEDGTEVSPSEWLSVESERDGTMVGGGKGAKVGSSLSERSKK